MKKRIELSPNCSISQIKANSGRNRQVELLGGIGALFHKSTINEKINYKSFFANPIDYYKELLHNNNQIYLPKN